MSAEDTNSNAQIIHPARDVLILLGNRTCQLWKLERGRGWHADKGTGDNAHSKGHENSFDDACRLQKFFQITSAYAMAPDVP